MKYEAIEQCSHTFAVKKMCKVLGVNASNYYRWRRNRKKNEANVKRELELVIKIEKIFKESDRTYGYRAIHACLKRENIDISEYKVRKIMRENGLYPETMTKYRPTHDGKGDGKYQEDRIKQNFKVNEKNKVWAGDITYIKTKIGCVYLAVVLDLYNREVIGYAMSKKIDTELTKQALANAVGRQGVKRGLIFHSDRGSQYVSKGYQKMLEENGIQSSMGRPGCPYDNSCAESFFATLKKERIYRRNYDTMEAVRQDMFRYIELFYNRKRLHSVLGYMSPVEYRLKYDAGKVA